MVKKTFKKKHKYKTSKNKTSKNKYHIYGGNENEIENNYEEKINGKKAYEQLKNLQQSDIENIENNENNILDNFIKEHLDNIVIDQFQLYLNEIQLKNLTRDENEENYNKIARGSYNVVYSSNNTNKVVRLPINVNKDIKYFLFSLWNWKYCEENNITPMIYRYSNINNRKNVVVVSKLCQPIETIFKKINKIKDVINNLSDAYLIHCDIKPNNLVVCNDTVQAIDLDFDFVKTHDIILKAIHYSLDKLVKQPKLGPLKENENLHDNLNNILNKHSTNIIKDFSKLFMSLILCGTLKYFNNDSLEITFDEYILYNNNTLNTDLLYLFQIIIECISLPGAEYFWCMQSTLSHYCGITDALSLINFLKNEYLITSELKEKINKHFNNMSGGLVKNPKDSINKDTVFKFMELKQTPTPKNIPNNNISTPIPPWENKQIIRPRNILNKNEYTSKYYEDEVEKLKKKWNGK